MVTCWNMQSAACDMISNIEVGQRVYVYVKLYHDHIILEVYWKLQLKNARILKTILLKFYRAIIKKRKNYEYRLARRQLEKDDFLGYIQVQEGC